MKSLLFSIGIILIACRSLGQSFEDYSNDPSFQVIKQEYATTIVDDDDRVNFKKLRELLNRKQEEFMRLKAERSDLLRYRYKDTSYYDQKINGLSEIIKTEKDINKQIKVSADLVYDDINIAYSSDTSYYGNFTVSVGQINSTIDYFKKKRNDAKKRDEFEKILNSNIKNVEQDIKDCQKQIDSALAPEYKQQAFRVNISICFTILIAFLLGAFFFIVYQKSDLTLSKDLLSGNGLQFITLFVLIISIILFGILSILKGSELAAILSGISGYILGKGTQRDLSLLLPGSSPGMPPQNVSNPVAGLQQPTPADPNATISPTNTTTQNNAQNAQQSGTDKEVPVIPRILSNY